MIGYIRNILAFSYVDGPGNRSVVFFQGCNMQCSYCHNPETIPLCFEATEEVKAMSVEEVYEQLKPYLPFTSGVTISGGECTLQDAFLLELVVFLFKLGISVLIDSNGSRPKVLEKLLPYVDGVMLDIKSVDQEEAKDLTGLPFKPVRESFQLLVEEKKLLEVRTVVEESLKSKEAVKWVCKELKDKAYTCIYKLIAFRPHGVVGEWSNKAMPSSETMKELQMLASQYGLEVVLIN